MIDMMNREVILLCYGDHATLRIQLERYLSRYVAMHTLPQKAVSLHIHRILVWKQFVLVYDWHGQPMEEFPFQLIAARSLIRAVLQEPIRIELIDELIIVERVV